jgi:hypothetical protein
LMIGPCRVMMVVVGWEVYMEGRCRGANIVCCIFDGG